MTFTENTAPHSRASKPSILAESDDGGGGADVINVNAVILHSKSSRALHRHLSASGASAAASAAPSREDLAAAEGERSLLQVTEASLWLDGSTERTYAHP